MPAAAGTVAAVLAVFSAACSYPVVDLPAGFRDRLIEGDGFIHRVFSNNHPASGLLHVYIEGDGRAWLSRNRIAAAPMVAEPLMLDLMTLDSQPSIYVGRPCYLGLSRSPRCHPRYWTSHRYAPAVVASLYRVIERLYAEGAYEGVVLFGHSGGGTLATLLASRLAQTRALVTIAPNLDVGAWARWHAFSPLSGSLDPARTGDFPVDILQVHWAGGRDANVPPALLLPLGPRLQGGEIRLLERFDHACCWRRIWPEQLEEVDEYVRSPKLETVNLETDPGSGEG